MLNLKLEYRFFLIVLFTSLVLFPSTVHAFTSYFEEDLYEGEETTIELEVLDTIEFTYYGKNYSLRTLGIYTESSTIRIEKRGFDINLGETKSFDIDNIMDYDINVSLISIDSHTAKFKIGLHKKPEEEEEEEENQTSGTNTTTTGSISSTTNKNLTTTSRTSTSRTYTTSTTKKTSTSSKDNNGIKTTGATTVRITINLTITQKSGILLIITSIILVGLFVYKKEYERLVKGIKKKSKIERFLKNIERGLKFILKKLRIKLGELIAGKEFEKMRRRRKNLPPSRHG